MVKHGFFRSLRRFWSIVLGICVVLAGTSLRATADTAPSYSCLVNGLLVQRTTPCDYTAGPAALLSGVALQGSGPYHATADQQAALALLEDQAVAATLDDHALPSSDATAAQTWARDDSEAELWGLLRKAAETPPAQRTLTQARAASWLADIFHRHAVAATQQAGMEYAKWAGLDQSAYQRLITSNPTKAEIKNFLAQFPQTYTNGGSAQNAGVSSGGYCTYRSPSPYDDEYTGNVFHRNGAPQQCFAPCPPTTQCLPVTPTADQFVRWGASAVDAPTFGNASFAAAARDIALGAGLGAAAAGTGGGVGLASGLSAAALVDAGLADALFPWLSIPFDPAEVTGATLDAAETAELAGSVTATAIGFAVAVVIAAIAIAVIQGVAVVEADQVPDSLAGAIVDTRSSDPDPATLMTDSTQVKAMFGLFVGATLPSPRVADCDNSNIAIGSSQATPCLNAPPVKPISGSDAAFRIQAQGSSTASTVNSITWKDSSAVTTNVARLSGPWVVQSMTDGSGNTFTFQTLRLRYTDWGGREQTAWVHRGADGRYTFLRLADVAPGDAPLDPKTCESLGLCANSSAIDYLGPDGTKLSASIVPAPQPTGPAPTVTLAPVGNPGCSDCNPIYNSYDKPTLVRGSFTPISATDSGTITVAWGDGSATSQVYGPGITGGTFNLLPSGGSVQFSTGHVYNDLGLFTAKVTVTSDNRQSTSVEILRDVGDSDALQPQAISGFGPIADHTYGDAPFRVFAHGGSSTEPVILLASGTIPGTSDPVCRLSDRSSFFLNAYATVTILGVGTCTISAVQAGKVGWAAAPTVSQSFTVARAPLTIQANDASMPFGGQAPPLTATFSGFVNGEDGGVLTGLSCTALDGAGRPVTTSTPSGKYPITCSVASAPNYQVVAQPGVLTVRATPGFVAAFGPNRSGDTTVPTSVGTNPSGVGAIAASADDSFAVADGRVVGWGDNSLGQTTIPPAATSSVTQIAATSGGGLALKNDNTLLDWGWLAPKIPAGLSGPLAPHISAITGENAYYLALAGGAVTEFGGTDGFGISTIPAAAKAGVIAIDSGTGHALALKDDGSVVAWGYNNAGQATVPDAAKSFVTAIAAGGNHSLALKNDHTVVAWGDTSNGLNTVPAAAQGKTIAIAAGAYFNAALLYNGTIVTWGTADTTQTIPPPTDGTATTALTAGARHLLTIRR
ncbi:MAG: MBG domain-containing protein [Actinomycetales bacterium]